MSQNRSLRRKSSDFIHIACYDPQGDSQSYSHALRVRTIVYTLANKIIPGSAQYNLRLEPYYVISLFIDKTQAVLRAILCRE